MYRASLFIFYHVYNQQTHNYFIKLYIYIYIYHNSLFVWSTLLHVSTLSFHHQTVNNQRLAKLHTFFKLQLLKIRFIKLRCFTSFYDCKCAFVGYNKKYKKNTVKTFLGPLEPCLKMYEICPTCTHFGLRVFPSSKPQHWNETFNNTCPGAHWPVFSSNSSSFAAFGWVWFSGDFKQLPLDLQTCT